jgi:hypothetical protein
MPCVPAAAAAVGVGASTRGARDERGVAATALKQRRAEDSLNTLSRATTVIAQNNQSGALVLPLQSGRMNAPFGVVLQKPLQTGDSCIRDVRPHVNGQSAVVGRNGCRTPSLIR